MRFLHSSARFHRIGERPDGGGHKMGKQEVLIPLSIKHSQKEVNHEAKGIDC